ncbi:hypothetical protein D3C72_2372470 [compost metagenome]
MARALHVAGQDVADAAVVLHRCVQRIDRSAGHAERNSHTFFFEHADCGFDRFHFGHEVSFTTGIDCIEDKRLPEGACRP